MHFEALEQTLRLRLVSGPVDKKFFFISRNSLSHTVDHFEALEQTCRLRQLSGSGDKYFFQLAESFKATVLGK